MTNQKTGDDANNKADAKKEKQDRLAQALRDNLKRRKDQARKAKK